jgi:methylamine---glutamate N-methyltransferase subunit B
MSNPVARNANAVDASKLTTDEINMILANAKALIEVQNCCRQDCIGTGVASNVPWFFRGRLGDYCFCGQSDLECKVEGSVGHGCAELMQSGMLEVRGNAGHALMGFAKGGLVVVHGNAKHRAGVGMAGGELIITGTVEAQAGFEMQSGSIIIFGSVGAMLGQGARSGTIYVAGEVESVSENVEEDRIREADKLRLSLLLLKASIESKPTHWKVFRVITPTVKH